MDTNTIANRLGTLLLATAMLAGCAKHAYESPAETSVKTTESYLTVKPGSGSDAGGGAKADLGVLLAYEHQIRIRMPGERIAARASEVQAACNSGKFGACAVLGMSQSGGDDPSATVQVRIVPDGVDKLIGLAGKGEQIAERSIQAEDLATAVRDNSLRQDRLRKEHARLLEFQDRKDLKIADVMTLSGRIAEIEAQLQAAEQEAAQQQRRISTQLVTLTFQTTRAQENTGEIGQAFKDVGSIVTGVVAFMIRAFAALLPVAVVLFVLVVVIRRIRRARRKS
ncbi:DUF4349 domain-containing protein [Lysobacter gummosus]|uniref:DUF4349 domain-containing protein n=1 Tax=Lysobacter gummosus TaxID=262324 RepID=UPI0036381A03